MAKRSKRRRREPVETVDYRDGDGNVLRLRTGLSPGTIAKVRERPRRAAATADDAWQRREELLFERLAVSWEIAGLPLTDQAMLLGRYRMADAEMRAWVQATIASHLERYIPELG